LTGLGPEHEYPTKSKTAERDYIHILDLADAHLLALQDEKEVPEGKVNAANLQFRSSLFHAQNRRSSHGTGQQDRWFAIEALKKLLSYVAKRFGDPARLVAQPDRARQMFGWEPVNSH